MESVVRASGDTLPRAETTVPMEREIKQVITGYPKGESLLRRRRARKFRRRVTLRAIVLRGADDLEAGLRAGRKLDDIGVKLAGMAGRAGLDVAEAVLLRLVAQERSRRTFAGKT